MRCLLLCACCCTRDARTFSIIMRLFVCYDVPVYFQTIPARATPRAHYYCCYYLIFSEQYDMMDGVGSCVPPVRLGVRRLILPPFSAGTHQCIPLHLVALTGADHCRFRVANNARSTATWRDDFGIIPQHLRHDGQYPCWRIS